MNPRTCWKLITLTIITTFNLGAVLVRQVNPQPLRLSARAAEVCNAQAKWMPQRQRAARCSSLYSISHTDVLALKYQPRAAIIWLACSRAIVSLPYAKGGQTGSHVGNVR
jgi:hypothetical protein